MMAVSERREKAADILADGLVKLLKGRSEAVGDREPTNDDEPTVSKVPHLELVRGEAAGDRP